MCVFPAAAIFGSPAMSIFIGRPRFWPYISVVRENGKSTEARGTQTMNLLFVCASNSVRSQMAEGWARHLGDESINVRSAGMQPFKVHPMAIHIMKQVGIDISRHQSRRLDDRLLKWADYIVTLSETVKPYSAFFPPDVKYDHWTIPNPDTLVSEEISQEQAYATIRDQIKLRVERLLRAIKKK
jgi:arsenate reductase (thioredoxin)